MPTAGAYAAAIEAGVLPDLRTAAASACPVLRILNHLPDGVLHSTPSTISEVLPDPTLFDLPGRVGRPIFVTTLLHGNETSGLLAIQDILRRYPAGGLPRRLLLFIGNVRAARAGVRTLDSQHDFNRAWPGTPQPDTTEAALMRAVYDYVAAQSPSVSIDIHNTTGRNPNFGVVDRLDSTFLGLASLFSNQVILFDKAKGVQQQALARLCPAVTVECGQSGTTGAEQPAVALIETCLGSPDLTHRVNHRMNLTILRALVSVKVPNQFTFSFDGSAADIRFCREIDLLNFQVVKKGTSIAELSDPGRGYLELEPLTEDSFSTYFDYTEGKITLTKSVIPTMLTRENRAVELDCLCHLMHRIDDTGRILPINGNLDAIRDRE